MKNVLYILETIILFVLMLPFFINYSGPKSITIPSFDQVKNSVSIKSDVPDDSNNAADFYKDEHPTLACVSAQGKSIGFPFVYKTSDGCAHGVAYDVGLWFDYATAFLIALGVTKITSMIVNRFV